MSGKQRPVAEVSVGSIHAAIWRNSKEGTPFYNVTLEVRKLGDSGEWQTFKSFSQLELLALAKAADLAFDEIAALRKGDKEGHPVG